MSLRTITAAKQSVDKMVGEGQSKLGGVMKNKKPMTSDELIDRLLNGTKLDEFGNRDDDDLWTMACRCDDIYTKNKLREIYRQCEELNKKVE